MIHVVMYMYMFNYFVGGCHSQKHKFEREQSEKPLCNMDSFGFCKEKKRCIKY